jgi:spermidine synthase
MCTRRFLSLERVTAAALGAVALATVAWAAAACADDAVLYEKQSPYNTIVVTEDGQGLRTLWFEKGGARQSVVKPGDADAIELPYARTMPAALAFVAEPRRVLIVGLGGGTIPTFLHKHCPQATIDVVDIDPEVVDVAKRFFGFQEGPPMHVYVQDGRRFIEECRDPYDMIFLDAFGSENIPYHLATREFLEAVRRAVTAEGVVVGNVWSRNANPLYDGMVRTYQEVFPSLGILDVQGAANKILLATPRRQPVGQDDLERRARTVSQQKHLPFDLGDFVRRGYHDAGQKDPAARVLTDQDQAKKAG